LSVIGQKEATAVMVQFFTDLCGKGDHGSPCADLASFALIPKVSEALWEQARQAKLRFDGGRVSMAAAAVEAVARQNGDGVSPG
jgi:hypothetical protein